MPFHHGLLFYLGTVFALYAGVSAAGHAWAQVRDRLTFRWTAVVVTAALLAADLANGFAADMGFRSGMYALSLAVVAVSLGLLFRPSRFTLPFQVAGSARKALDRAAAAVAPGAPQATGPAGMAAFVLLAAGAALAALGVFADAPFPAGDSLVQVSAIADEMRHLPLAGLLVGTATWPQDGFGLFNVLVMLFCPSNDHLPLFLAGRLLSLGCMIAVAGVVYFAACRRFGALAAALGAGCLLLVQHFHLYRLIEDFLFILLLLANIRVMSRVIDRQKLWWLAGLAAGLCVYTKGTGVLLLPVFAILVARRHGRSALWGKNFASYIALFALFLVPNLAQLHLHGAQEQGLSLFHLLYFKPAAFDYGSLVKQAALEASRPGLLDALVNRFSLQTVGELACGIVFSFNGGLFELHPTIIVSGILVSAFALVPGLAGERLVPLRNAMVVTIAVFLPFFGLASWKAGESGNFILVFGPVLFVYLFRNLFVLLRFNHTAGYWRKLVVAALLPAVLAIAWTVPWAKVQGLTTHEEMPLAPAEARLVEWLHQEVRPGTIWFVSSDAYQFNPSYFVPGMTLEYHDVATSLEWMRYRCKTYDACYAVFHERESGGRRLGLKPVFADSAPGGYSVFLVWERPCAE